MKRLKQFKKAGIQKKMMGLNLGLFLLLVSLTAGCLSNPRPTKQPELQRVESKKMLEAEKMKEALLPPPLRRAGFPRWWARVGIS